MPKAEKPIDEYEGDPGETASSQRGATGTAGSLAGALIKFVFGLALMVVSVVGLLGIFFIIFATFFSVLFGSPIHALPLLGGIADIGMGLFGFMWGIARFLANITMVILFLVLMYLFFTGRLSDL